MRTSDTIAVAGTVGTEPQHHVNDSGLEITSFRLASNREKYNKETGKWEQHDTNWYTVSSFRSLAGNVAASVKKGERVTVIGRLKISKWESGEKSGTAVEIDADTVGLDLTFARAVRPMPPRRDDAGADNAPATGGFGGGFPSGLEEGTGGATEQASASFLPPDTAASSDEAGGDDEGERVDGAEVLAGT